MIRYELDRLGWYEFEGLIQTLLKHMLGLGIEAWGGTGDWGRDAYFKNALQYPSKQQASGPFLFQCKFIDGANASGANSRDALRRAVSEEAKLVPRRLPVWGATPTHFILLTNAQVSGTERDWIASTIHAVLPNSSVHIHDGQDICAWLDNASHIARAFPQILGMRDLEALITQWNIRDVFNRSEIAISDARTLSAVFVPTEPYSQALKVIAQHQFVVLEGPPEMGKTAIARMIALTYLARGWQVIECRVPEDLLKAFSKDRPQIFVADDFFGRTEYDTSRISKWQDDLPFVLKHLDKQHLFALTTRAHLLNLARARLDIAGYEGRFPDVGEVIVDASKLSKMDKARMLYRHCKAADLPSSVRKIVKEQAEAVVLNSHFTPERIRRLVHDVLGTKDASKKTKKAIVEGIEQTLADPTKAMSVSFGALPEPHKWMLFSLLEADFAPYRYIDEKKDPLADIRVRFERNCPMPDRLPVKRVASELSEAFVRHPNKKAGRTELDWIHPSVRDLAISELSALPKYRKTFLRTCGPEGLRLACSIGGGSKGQISFPLLVDDDDWSVFRARTRETVSTSPEFISVLASTFDAAKRQGGLEKNAKRLSSVLYDDALPEYLLRRGPPTSWKAGVDAEFLEIFKGGRQHPLFNDVADLWIQDAADAEREIARSAEILDEVDSALATLNVGELLIAKFEKVDKKKISDCMQRLVNAMVRGVEEQYDYLRHRHEQMDLDNEIYSLTEFIDRLRSIDHNEDFAGLVEVAGGVALMEEVLGHMENLNSPGTGQGDSSTPARPSEEVAVAKLFSDL